jgi:menaquinone-specific isochorismate synthase
MTPVFADVASELRTAIAQIKTALHSKIARALEISPARPQLIRIERPVAPLAMLDWLSLCKAGRKVYWRDRDGTLEAAGIGEADTVKGDGIRNADQILDYIHARFESCELSARYYGGFRFDWDKSIVSRSEEWKAFGGACFVLPLVEVFRQGEQTIVAGQVVINPGFSHSPDELLRPFDVIADMDESPTVNPQRISSRTNLPDRKDWQERVNRVVSQVQKGVLQKLVLARRVTFRIADEENPLALVSRCHCGEESATQFAFQMSEGTTFYGAPPELLYRRSGRNIYSEAIAGTRRLGRDEKENYRLANELFASPKDRLEVDLVRTGIGEALAPLCDKLTIDERPQILHAATVQHLRYAFNGQLGERSSDADILNALSPTPAVGGSPREAAMALIRELELFDRGWYAGPVGWVSRDAATFAVGIRSALVHGRNVHVYSGAGLVDGSDPDSEWNELDTKISQYLTALET